MNDNLRMRRFKLTSMSLRIWGLVCLMAGMLGRGIIQNGMLGIGSVSGQQLLTAMNEQPELMRYATAAIILQGIEACAVPIFAFLLVEGFCHTSNFKMYVLRVACIAALAEIPYNMIVSGGFWDLTSRNPAFGLVICLVMLYLYNRYPGFSFNAFIIKAAVTLCGFLWMDMLGIQDGAPLLLLAAVMWMLRKKSIYRDLFGATAAFACCIFSPYYVAAPFAMLFVHLYCGERGAENRIANYLAYPVLMLAIAAVVYFMR